MNEQELNKKSAKWAGFNLSDIKFDLNACFKWLVPPLEGFYILKYRDEFLAVAVKDGRCGQAFHKEAAMAICLAIDKMLEEK